MIASDTGKHLVARAADLKSRATSLQARSPYEYQRVTQFVKDAKAQWNELEAQRKLDKEPFLESGREVDSFYAEALRFCKDAETSGKRVLLAYEEQQARAAAEAQRLAEEQAQRDRERLEAAAAEVREADPELSAELKAQAVDVIAPNVAAEIPVILGNSTRTIWKHRVTNSKLVPREYMVVNDSMLATVARTTKENHPDIPGVEFYPDKTKSITT